MMELGAVLMRPGSGCPESEPLTAWVGSLWNLSLWQGSGRAQHAEATRHLHL